ncbi:ABC transporter permease [Micromonospora sp. KC213]|uniref:ABC transporter permease n=1 Tax=Micromonospora sp. KC213 TaxID=2530378 RepID=UPI00104C0A87|nr:ABC transporter permease [Micromonospora sp. KC213]TDC38629.1 ABC transporter permease [Micromonospora sp. KC213]
MAERRAAITVAAVIARGVVTAAGLLLVASVLVFVLVRAAPGDAVDVEFGESGASALLSSEEEAAARAQRARELGLDRSVPEQYVRWLSRVVRLDLGISFRTGRPVADELVERVPASAALGGAGFLVALAGAWLIGLLSARRPGGLLDHVLRLLSLAATAVPTFLLGSLALRYAAEWIGYPIAGEASWRRLWLPAVVLGVGAMPVVARLLRASLISEYGRPYALAARARGASPARVTFRHVMRPAFTPLLTLAGLTLASLVAASVITEVIFSWPGVSEYAVAAISAKDYPVVQAYLLLVVVVVVVVNRAVDVIQHLLDPRVGQAAEVMA